MSFETKLNRFDSRRKLELIIVITVSLVYVHFCMFIVLVVI